MTYYLNKIVAGTFVQVIDRVTEALKLEGFGILTDVDVKATMKKKLDVEFRNYRILGACNPTLALEALGADDKVGTMLPCNVIVQELALNKAEVATINPSVSMASIGNTALTKTAQVVTEKLERVLAEL